MKAVGISSLLQVHNVGFSLNAHVKCQSDCQTLYTSTENNFTMDLLGIDLTSGKPDGNLSYGSNQIHLKNFSSIKK